MSRTVSVDPTYVPDMNQSTPKCPREAAQAVVELHCKSEGPGGTTDGYCAECGWLWPCRTWHEAQGFGDGEDCYEARWCCHAEVVMR
jgi:hypothetical protein